MNRSFPFFIVLCVFAFAACNRGGKTGLLVPKDAGLVLHINLSALSSKLSWKEIQQTAWYSEALEIAKDSFTKKLLADPASSGIDTRGSVVIFIKRNGNKGYMAFEGGLKNAEQFKTTLQQIGEGQLKVQNDGNLHYATIENNDGVLYFTDKTFAFVTDASETKKLVRGQRVPQTGISPQRYPIDSLKQFARNIFSLKRNDLLDCDKRFAGLIEEKADVHYWLNGGNFYTDVPIGPMAMAKTENVLTDNIIAGTANFENGKIIVDAQQFFNQKLTDLFTKYGGKEISNDVLSRMPDSSTLAALAMNYNPEGIKEFLKLLGVDGLANAALGQLGLNFTVDDFVKANAGELAFAITDFAVKAIPASVTLNDGQVIPYIDEKPEAKFLFGIAVNDKNSFQKLIDGVEKLRERGVWPFGEGLISSELKNKSNDKWFALGSNDADINAFLSGNKQPAYTNTFRGHNGGGFVNLQKFIPAVAAGETDTASKRVYDISAAFWKSMNMFWDVKGGASAFHFEISLADGNTNSLKQLNHYFNDMYKAMPKENAEDGWALPAPSTSDTDAGE